MKKFTIAFFLALLTIWSFSAISSPSLLWAQDEELEEETEEDSDISDDSDEEEATEDAEDEEESTEEAPVEDTENTEKSTGIPTNGKDAADRAVWRLNGINYVFRWCPRGKFTMGSPITEQRRHTDENEHEVELSQGFWMLETEVTLKMFSQFVRETHYVTEAEQDDEGGYALNTKDGQILGPSKDYNWKNVGFRQTRDFPVVNITWNDAQAFVAWVNQRFAEISGSEQTPLVAALPTEAQWEYACRAGTVHAYGKERDPDRLKDYANLRSLTNSRKMNALWGMDNLPWVILADQPYLYSAPSASFYPNPWGLFDMHGNVWEWCQDWHESFDVLSVLDPQGPKTGTNRVYRGGAWNTSYDYARCAARGKNVPSRRFVTLGFRFVLNPFVVRSEEKVERRELTASEKFYGYFDTMLETEKTELDRFNEKLDRDFDSPQIPAWDKP